MFIQEVQQVGRNSWRTLWAEEKTKVMWGTIVSGCQEEFEETGRWEGNQQARTL